MTSERRTNHFERLRLTRSVWGWSYAFERPSPAATSQAFGLEIGVVLSGTRIVETPHRGSSRYERGRISVFGLGEPYSTRWVPYDEVPGREIGLFVRTDALERWTSTERVVRFPGRGDLEDGRLVELAESIASSVDRREPIAGEDVEAEVRAFVERHGELAEIDRVERARLEIVRHFDRPLYMRHFAEIAGVHEETFARKFAARYGVTPTRYRRLVRLKEAAILLATQPDLPVRDVAKKVGFDDPAYFHRAFAAQFGSTPLGLARAFTDPVAA